MVGTVNYIKITVPAGGDMIMEYIYYGQVLQETNTLITILSGHTQASFMRDRVKIEPWDGIDPRAGK